MALSHLSDPYDMRDSNMFGWEHSLERMYGSRTPYLINNEQPKGDKMFKNIIEKLQEKRNTPVEVIEANSTIQKPMMNNNAVDDMLNTQKEFEKSLLQLLEDVNEDEINKANKLNKLGFGQSINSRPIRDKNKNAEKSKLLSDLSKYYEEKYGLKFVSYDVCHNICEKHKLIIARTDKYIGEVPDEAIHDIEKFKGVEYADLDGRLKREVASGHFIVPVEQENQKNKLYKQLHIIAPEKLLNTEGYTVVNYELIPKNLDPIVIQEVNQGYLIITAWGDEKKIVENL